MCIQKIVWDILYIAILYLTQEKYDWIWIYLHMCIKCLLCFFWYQIYMLGKLKTILVAKYYNKEKWKPCWFKACSINMYYLGGIRNLCVKLISFFLPHFIVRGETSIVLVFCFLFYHVFLYCKLYVKFGV